MLPSSQPDDDHHSQPDYFAQVSGQSFFVLMCWLIKVAVKVEGTNKWLQS